MAKIYAAPPKFKAPNINPLLPFDEYCKQSEAYLDKLRTWCKERATGHKDDDMLGAILSYGVADGKAQYMVCDVRTRIVGLIHIELGDAWRAHALIERGINKQEVRQQMKREAAYKELFGPKKEKA